MTVFIDADGCPVVDITDKLSKRAGVDVVIVCDTSHVFEYDGARTVTVPKGNDSVDFKLVNMVQKGDIVITQDYGYPRFYKIRTLLGNVMKINAFPNKRFGFYTIAS